MNKVGIITLNGYSNYGNRLQNYALQEAIKMLDFECETIINNTIARPRVPESKISKIKKFFNKDFSEKFQTINNKFNKKQISQLKQERTKVFREFSEKYINETKYSISIDNIPENFHVEYNYFVAGSDQVWNPNDETLSEINFMTFAPIKKRLAYAPSFGISAISDDYKKRYKEWLENINSISVREKEGAKIIRDLTGRDAKVVLDPTMLIAKEKWLSISKKAKNKPTEDYLLTYFLGEISKEVRSKMNKIAKENNLQIVNLANISDKQHYATGPSEFIDYINSASLFITDSFHGCVFSVLLETPFIVCDRVGHTKEQNMNSRIETFTTKFQLQARKFNNIKDKEIFRNNYRQANKILQLEREKSWNYIKEALEVNA